MQMLLLWQQKRRHRATLLALLAHLVRCELTELSEDLAEVSHVPWKHVLAELEKPRDKKSKHIEFELSNHKDKKHSSKRGQKQKEPKRAPLISQSSGVSSENGFCPSSPDSELNGGGKLRTSESSEGYHSSGSRGKLKAKIKARDKENNQNSVSSKSSSSRHKTGGKNRPQLILPDASQPDVEIYKDHVKKKASNHSQPREQKHSSRQNHSRRLENGSSRTHRIRTESGASDLIVSEGGSDVAEVSDSDSDEEVATSTMLDYCPGGERASGGAGAGETPRTRANGSSSASASGEEDSDDPDELLQQTVPKNLEEPYRLEYVYS